MGVPLNHPNFHGISMDFPLINQPFGGSPFVETSIFPFHPLPIGIDPGISRLEDYIPPSTEMIRNGSRCWLGRWYIMDYRGFFSDNDNLWQSVRIHHPWKNPWSSPIYIYIYIYISGNEHSPHWSTDPRVFFGFTAQQQRMAGLAPISPYHSSVNGARLNHSMWQVDPLHL